MSFYLFIYTKFLIINSAKIFVCWWHLLCNIWLFGDLLTFHVVCVVSKAITFWADSKKVEKQSWIEVIRPDDYEMVIILDSYFSFVIIYYGKPHDASDIILYLLISIHIHYLHIFTIFTTFFTISAGSHFTWNWKHFLAWTKIKSSVPSFTITGMYSNRHMELMSNNITWLDESVISNRSCGLFTFL